MDYSKKKIVFISLESLIKTISGADRPKDATDCYIRKDVIDRFRAMGMLSRVSILANRPSLSLEDFMPLGKSVEFFTFLYCGVAADIHVCHEDGARMMPGTGMVDEVIDVLPKGLKSLKGLLFVGCSETDMETAEKCGIEYVNVEDFANGQD